MVRKISTKLWAMGHQPCWDTPLLCIWQPNILWAGPGFDYWLITINLGSSTVSNDFLHCIWPLTTSWIQVYYFFNPLSFISPHLRRSVFTLEFDTNLLLCIRCETLITSDTVTSLEQSCNCVSVHTQMNSSRKRTEYNIHALCGMQ